MKRLLYYIALPCLLVACGGKNTPTKPIQVETKLTQGYLLFYGQYYDSINYNVLSLDLYSQGITLDSLSRIQGSGSNLCLSDIFIPLSDSILPNGIYRCDSTPAQQTFLPAKNFEGAITGTYLLQIEKEQIIKKILFSDSTFTLTQQGDTTDIKFNLIADKKKYAIHYRGVLQYEDKRKHL